MQVFPSPISLRELTNNIRSVITDKRPLLLGQECEVILGQTSISNAPLQKISTLFENIIIQEQHPKELIEFKSILTIYDRMLTMSDFQVPKENSYTFFGSLIERVRQVYQSMPLSKTLPATSGLISLYKSRIQKPAKEIQPFLETSRNILTLLQLEKIHYEWVSPIAHFSINTMLSSKVLDYGNLSDEPASAVLAIMDKVIVKKDLISLSQINFGFALLFYNYCHSKKQKDSNIDILTIDVSHITEKELLELINQLNELLNGEYSLKEDLVSLLIFYKKFLLGDVIGRSNIKYLRIGNLRLAELIAPKIRDLSLSIMRNDPFKKELHFPSLNNAVFNYHYDLNSDPLASEVANKNFFLFWHEQVTAIELSLDHLQELYKVVHLELFKMPETLSLKEKLAFYKSQKSIYDNEKFVDPSEFCKPISFDKTASTQDATSKTTTSVSSRQNETTASSEWLPPSLKQKQVPKKKSPAPTIASHSTNDQLIAQPTPLPVALTQTVQSHPAPSAIPYDARVHDWRINPDKMLSLPSFSSKSARSKEQSRIFHAFALEVDKYIFSHGIKSRWSNEKRNKEDVHFSIPGEITFDGEIKRGIFTYCFDEDNICYHRCFTEKTSGDAMREYIEKGFWEVDFPPLEASREKVKIARSEQTAHDGSFLSKQINSYTLEIEDPRNHATIRLFQIKPT